jgi:hypothetical protein
MDWVKHTRIELPAATDLTFLSPLKRGLFFEVPRYERRPLLDYTQAPDFRNISRRIEAIWMTETF